MSDEPDYVRNPVDDLDHEKAWRRGWGSGRRRRRRPFYIQWWMIITGIGALAAIILAVVLLVG